MLLPPTTDIGFSDDLSRLVAQHEITKSSMSPRSTPATALKPAMNWAPTFSAPAEEWPGRGSMPTDEAIARIAAAPEAIARATKSSRREWG